MLWGNYITKTFVISFHFIISIWNETYCLQKSVLVGILFPSRRSTTSIFKTLLKLYLDPAQRIPQGQCFSSLLHPGVASIFHPMENCQLSFQLLSLLAYFCISVSCKLSWNKISEVSLSSSHHAPCFCCCWFIYYFWWTYRTWRNPIFIQMPQLLKYLIIFSFMQATRDWTF